jgi:arylsulfatase
MIMQITGSGNKQKGFAVLGGLCLLAYSCNTGNHQSDKNKLNVVFLLADDLRWNSLGCAGNSMLQTKNIDQLARDGIRFSNACVTTSISMVSRANLLTGQYMSRHKIRDFGIQLSDTAFSQTYPAILRKAGYWTGYVGKFGVGNIRRDNFDFSIEYEGRHWIKESAGDSVHVTVKNSRDALQFLKQRPKDKPFLLTVGFFATHAQDNHPDQYLYQPESSKFYENDIIPVSETASDKYINLLPPFIASEKNEGRIRWHKRFDTPEKYQKYMKAYYRMLTELDIAVGEIIKELKTEGVYENTLIIFMGDNGYFHGEHGLADKWYPYEESIKVPLIVRDPRLPEKRRDIINQEFVLNIDIAPFILASTGQAIPQSMQGEDFSVLYLKGEKRNWRKDFFYEHPFVTDEERIPSSEALVTHTDKYILWPHYNFEEYFDLKADPYEKHNGIMDSVNINKIRVIKNRFNELKEAAK